MSRIRSPGLFRDRQEGNERSFSFFDLSYCQRIKQAGGKDMKEKTFDELTIQDDFIFGKVMQDMKNLRPLLERILPEIDFTDLKCIIPQKSMEEYYGKHGIRVDVFTEDDEHMFSVEMQVGKKEDLAKRTRYYQSVMDMDDLLKGQDYWELRKQYVIFICPKDPFDDNMMMYTYRNVCEETGKELGDETTVIFLNCEGKNREKYPQLKAFAEYVNGKESEDSYIRQLEEEVRKAKMDPVWRAEFMDMRSKLHYERREGREEGMKKGREEGHAQRNRELILSLHQKNKTDEEIAELLDLGIEEVKNILLSLK